jgi:RNA recognition motif-containing protein
MQGNKLYVGNLSYSMTEQELNDVFSNYGQVESVKIIEGRGFGFVEMASQQDAEKAKEKLDGYELKGRNLRVNEARARDRKPPRRDNYNRY